MSRYLSGRISGGVAIKPDLTFVSFNLERLDAEPGQEVAPDWQTAALVAGSRRYPALIALLPQRPNGARACNDCGGVGYFHNNKGFVCKTCAGLGWLKPQT